jgi:serine/threonine protein kinase
MQNNKNNNDKNNKNNNDKNSTSLNGGKVIGSGGFGCVFKPAIKCKDEKRNENDDKITKLMKKKYANIEFKGIQKYREMLKDVPNFSDYFLVEGFSTCEPDKLDDEDLIKFNKKCSALKKMKITAENVNNSLKKLMSLNMPYGGVDVGDYIETNEMDYKKLNKMNISLIGLLKNGILPMNEKNIFHCDIKDSNILVQEEESGEVKTRLIDWGLSTVFKERNSIPKPLSGRPFQFNVPFSVILFNDTFTQMYTEFLKKNKEPSYFITRSFVINYVVTWINKRGPGHLKSLNSIFKSFFERGLINIEKQFKDDIIEFEYTFYFIFEYISYVVFKFTKDGKFDRMKYFSEVFLKNLDVWGLIMTYLPILEYLDSYYDELHECELEIIEKIKTVVLYAIECSYVPIDCDKVIKHLDELNLLFLKADKLSTVHFKEKRATSSTKQSNSKTSFKTKTNSKTNSKSMSKSNSSVASSSSASGSKTRKNSGKSSSKTRRNTTQIK